MGIFDGIVSRIEQQAVRGLDTASRPLLNRQPVMDGADTPLLGGINLERAKALYQQAAGTQFARKNLFRLRITDVSPLNFASGTFDSISSMLSGGFDVDTLVTLGSLAAAFSTRSKKLDFNLFATDVSYPLSPTSHDSQRINTASFSRSQGRELVEMRITTMDDEHGTLKKWYKLKNSMHYLPNGALGLPITYLLNVSVKHAYFDDDVSGADNAYEDNFLMFASGLECDLSRKEDGLQELQLTLTQFDTFSVVM